MYQTWEIVLRSRHKKPVGCRWVYTLKYKGYGSLERYKARLVAKGYSQTYGIGYLETFAPVAKKDTMRVLSSLEAQFWYEFTAIDVKNAFSQWFGRRNVSGDSTWFWWKNRTMWGVPTKESTIWINAVTKAMIWKIDRSYATNGI